MADRPKNAFAGDTRTSRVRSGNRDPCCPPPCQPPNPQTPLPPQHDRRRVAWVPTVIVHRSSDAARTAGGTTDTRAIVMGCNPSKDGGPINDNRDTGSAAATAASSTKKTSQSYVADSVLIPLTDGKTERMRVITPLPERRRAGRLVSSSLESLVAITRRRVQPWELSTNTPKYVKFYTNIPVR